MSMLLIVNDNDNVHNYFVFVLEIDVGRLLFGD